MNRDELVKLIATTLYRAPYYHEDAAPVITDALWPVLAQVWDEGFSEAERHVERDAPIRNPYGDSA